MAAMSRRVTVKEASELLGVSRQYIRIGLQAGRLPFGSAVKTSDRWTYHISAEALRRYIEGESTT